MFEKDQKLVYIGSDHAGFQMKNEMKTHLEGKGFHVTDLGVFNEEPSDYPDVGREIGEKVMENGGSYGIAICGSGIGICMAVNKIVGVRGVLAVDEKMAEASRKHNNANVLCLQGRDADVERSKRIVDKFFATEFEKDQERHVRRVKKLSEM